MSRSRKEQTSSEALAGLREQLRAGKPQPAKRPGWLSLRSIKQHPGVFQHRRPAKHASEAHVRALVSVVNTSGMLEPVTVWWDGKAWACVDGHHRLAAYTKADRETPSVPVQVFEGSLEDALVLAARTNTKDKLPMARAEKSNAAWRLVLTTPASKATLAEAAGVSERTVAHMRRVKETLRDAGKHRVEELLDMTWDAARRLSLGQEAPDWDPQEEERRAQEFATKLHKVFGLQGPKQPDIFLRAVQLYSPKLYDTMEAMLRDQLDEESGEGLE